MSVGMGCLSKYRIQNISNSTEIGTTSPKITQQNLNFPLSNLRSSLSALLSTLTLLSFLFLFTTSPSIPSISTATGYLWVSFGGATQRDPIDGSFNLLGRLHLISSFFWILCSDCNGVVKPRLFPRRDIHLFEHRPCLCRLLALRSGMPIFLAILA